MVTVDHNKNIQRIIDNVEADTSLFDFGATVGKLREVNFGDPEQNKDKGIDQIPALYVTTKKSIQNTRYSFGYLNANNQNQVTIEYEMVVLAESKETSERSQKQIYELVKNIQNFVNSDPTFAIPITQPNPGTDPIFTRCVISSINWKPETKGKLITVVSFTLLATIGTAYLANFPDIGDVILLSKPNAPEGIIFSENREQQNPNRVLTENGDFGALFVEYESTVALDNQFRAKFGDEEDVTITTASGARVYHIQYIEINPTADFDQIERTILHMEIIPN